MWSEDDSPAALAGATVVFCLPKALRFYRKPTHAQRDQVDLLR